MERSERKVIVLPRFKSSLIEIWDYIAEDSVKQADKFVANLSEVMEAIERNPEANAMFRPLAGKRKLYRYKIFKKNYLVIYKLLKLKLVYIRIVSSKRDPKFYETLKNKY